MAPRSYSMKLWRRGSGSEMGGGLWVVEMGGGCGVSGGREGRFGVLCVGV